MNPILPRLKPGLAVALVLATVLTACGLKGDLYLPEATPPAEAPAQDDDGDDEPDS